MAVAQITKVMPKWTRVKFLEEVASIDLLLNAAAYGEEWAFISLTKQGEATQRLIDEGLSEGLL